MPIKKTKLPIGAILTALILGVFLFFYNHSIVKKERLLSSGKEVILPLEPLDPRSIMQGDYVELRFADGQEIEWSLEKKLEETRQGSIAGHGLAVMVLQDGLYKFQRLYDGTPVQDKTELLLQYGWRNERVVFGGGTFFFKEGFGREFERGRFAKLRVDEKGVGIIVALLDENMKEIEAVRDKE